MSGEGQPRAAVPSEPVASEPVADDPIDRQAATLAGSAQAAVDSRNQPTIQPSSTAEVQAQHSDAGIVIGATTSPMTGLASSADQTVQLFGDYELLGELARGGMGVVFKARQIKLNRLVALKMILVGRLASQQDVQRFLTEAEAAAKLDHPGIVPIFEVGERDGQQFFSMGFVEGGSLAQRVAQGPLPPREAAQLVLEVARAVQYAHEKGVIHRDLKPANILLDEQGKPRITDFGLAKLTGGGSEMTGTGQVLGTPSYMPPEQAAGNIDLLGPVSDVYSLGAILYCLMTGRPPFQSAGLMETLKQVIEREPIAPRQLNPDVPLDLNTIALKCLEKDPARRYATAQAVADELQRYVNGEPIHARPITMIERGWRWCRRKPLLPGIIAAALGISVMAGLLYRLQSAIVRRESLHREVITAVDAAQNNRGPAVPYAIRDLKKLPRDMVVIELKSRYADARYADVRPAGKPGLAYALAAYGDVDAAFLCSRIGQSAADEIDNLVAAFEHDRDRSLQAIHEAAAQSQSGKDWRLKARLATVALFLGDATIAADMCRIDDRSDPVQRTIFIDEFPTWHADIERLVSVCKGRSDSAFRSAICLGIGGIPVERLTSADLDAWKPVLAKWFQTAPDNVTHSAAGWALRQWKAELPGLTVSRHPEPGRDWFVNSLGMTMLKIRPAGFERTTRIQEPNDQAWKAISQSVTLTREFHFCDREVSTAQFQRFIDDAECPAAEKPEDWPQRDYALTGEIANHPQANVNWYDSVLFCNWLSRQENLAPCYERTGKKQQLRKDNNQVVEFDEWRLSPNSTGYRLPTEAEWEYACRAGTTTDYSFGTDPDLLRKYAVYATGNTRGVSPCGSKLPNAWGLFDVHGNLWEWCCDWHGDYGAGDATDPTGPWDPPSDQAAHRVFRGGSWRDDASYCQSGRRNSFVPGGRGGIFGFRLVLGFVQSRVASGAGNVGP